MLHVKGGDYRDAIGDQILDVLVALVVARTRRRWCARSSSTIAISGLRARIASTSISFSVTPRYGISRSGTDLQVANLARPFPRGRGFRRIRSRRRGLVAQLMRLVEHPIGLADAGRPTQVNLQPPLSACATRSRKTCAMRIVVAGRHGMRIRSGAAESRPTTDRAMVRIEDRRRTRHQMPRNRQRSTNDRQPSSDDEGRRRRSFEV